MTRLYKQFNHKPTSVGVWRQDFSVIGLLHECFGIFTQVKDLNTSSATASNKYFPLADACLLSPVSPETKKEIKN